MFKHAKHEKSQESQLLPNHSQFTPKPPKTHSIALLPTKSNKIHQNPSKSTHNRLFTHNSHDTVTKHPHKHSHCALNANTHQQSPTIPNTPKHSPIITVSLEIALATQTHCVFHSYRKTLNSSTAQPTRCCCSDTE